jgi:vancomycin resistance protein YoaR
MLAGVVLGLVSLPFVESRLPVAPTLVGLTVEGEALPAGTDARAFLDVRATAFAARRVVLRHGGHRFQVSLAELGASIDVEATLERMLAAGHSGSIVKRLRETARARAGELDVAIVYRLDDVSARTVIRRYAEALRREPVDAELDLEGHARLPDEPGQELDVAASYEQLAAAFHRDEAIDLVTRPVKAKITLHDLDDIDVSKVLSRSETRFAPFKTGRSENVRLAVSKLNGVVLRPGDTLSFNERVGPRSIDRGFQLAPEIVGDELTTGVGGGTCQVSSTLHAAAIYGGLEVVQRKSHTRPSDYTKLGLDATVAYPEVDLRLRNPFRFTLIVHAIIPEDGVLRVELLGGEAVDSVDYRYGVSRIEEYVRRITVKRFLQPGKVIRRQKGTRGMDVHSYVTIRFKDGRVEERRYYSGYRATPEVYWVAPNYDEEELPPLPKHAKGVEGRLQEDGSDLYPSTG